MKNGIRRSIGKMIIATLVTTAIFAVIGLVVGFTWFANEARPAIRTIRDASAWTSKFYLLFLGGCVFSLIYTILAARFGGYRRSSWIRNVVITTFVGVFLSALMYILYPTKDASVSMVASALILLEGFGIFFISSMFAPASWDWPIKLG